MKKSFILKFYPKPDQNKPSEAIIYECIGIERKKAEFSTGIRIQIKAWDEINDIVRKDKRASAEIGEIRSKILRIKDHLALRNFQIPKQYFRI